MPYSAEQLSRQPSYELLGTEFINCDNLPNLASQRQQFYQEGSMILQGNHNVLETDGFDAVSLPVDVLSTARVLVNYGPGTREYQELDEALQLDCDRITSEAYRRTKPEYFPPVFQKRDILTGQYSVSGINTRKMAENGLSPLLIPEAQAVRLVDYVDVRTKEAIGNDPLASERVSLLTIKPIPEYIRREHKRDPNQPFGGYVPSINKFAMVNERFDDDGCYQEFLVVPGEYITDEVMSEGLAEVTGEEYISLSSMEISSRPVISMSDDPMMDMMKILDRIATLTSGVNVFMGEKVSDDHQKDYQQFRAEAVERQSKQKDVAAELKQELIDHASSGLDSRVASIRLYDSLKSKLWQKAYEQPSIAAEIFDENTAEGIRQAMEMERDGMDPTDHLTKVYDEAPAPPNCGPGSCGLERPTNAAEVAIVQGLGLKGEVVKDTERPCFKCGEKAVYYGLEGGKACASCKAFEGAK